jgi:hypothetical protein
MKGEDSAKTQKNGWGEDLIRGLELDDWVT